MGISTRLGDWLGQGFRAARVVRAPLAVSIFAALVLSLPDQTQELYRILAQDFGADDYIQNAQSLFTLLFGVTAAIAVWLIARNVTLTRAKNVLASQSFEGVLLRWLPRVCGALIPLGMAAGLWFASQDVTFGNLGGDALKGTPLEGIRSRIAETAGPLRYAAGSALLLAVALLGLAYLRTRGRADKYAEPSRWLFGTRGRLLLLIVLAGIVVYFMTLPVAGPQLLGSIAIFLIFIVVAATITSLMTAYSDRHGIPAMTLLVLFAVLLSVFGTNENHFVRPYDDERSGEPEIDQSKSNFEGWYQARGDRTFYETRGERYPVFVVAAAGGALYAAHHTATFLARMQDRCENFAQHVFAISSVSGGSLGAAVFAGLAKEFAKNGEANSCDFGIPQETGAEASPGPFEQRAHAFLKNDFLSPMVAAALFPDALQRFLPRPIESFDRSKALEASFEAAWSKALPMTDNPFIRGYRKHWRPDGAAPALLLNATEVSNGHRVVFAPFSPGESSKWAKMTWLNPLLSSGPANEKDIKLSSAVGISARYPWILPAATVPTRRTVFHLVDGGYVESSGIETATELVRTLEADNNGRFTFHLIVLGGFVGVDDVQKYQLNEATSPIRALVSAWQSRAELAFYRAWDTFCPKGRCVKELSEDAADMRGRVMFPVEPVFLNLRDFQLPLAWQLSDLSRKIIGLHSGDARTCRSGYAFPLGWSDKAAKVSRIAGAPQFNSCSACMVQYKLAAQSLAPKKEMDFLCQRKD